MKDHKSEPWFPAAQAVDEPVAPSVVRRVLAYGPDAMCVENRFETGGVGTTIFYVVGSVLVLAAVVLLVTKKRMNSGK